MTKQEKLKNFERMLTKYPSEQGEKPAPVQGEMFDYSKLPSDIARLAKESAIEIKVREKAVWENIIEIGNRLIKVKNALPHGQFGQWVDFEFEWNDSTARKYMTISKEIESNRSYTNVLPNSINALYQLASALGKADDDTKQEILEQVEAKTEEKGKALTEKEIKEITAKYEAELEAKNKELKAKDDRISQLSMNFERLDQTNKQLEESLYEADEKLEKTKAEYEEKVEKRAKMLASVEADKVAREYQKQIEKLETEKTKLENAKKQAIEEGKKAMEALKANPDPETQDKINALRKEEYLLAKQLEQVETRLSNAKSAEELRVSNAHAFQNFSDGYQRWIASNPKAIAAITSGQIGDYSLAEAEMLANSLETFANQIREAVQTARIENAREVEDTPMKLIEAEVYAD